MCSTLFKGKALEPCGCVDVQMSLTVLRGRMFHKIAAIFAICDCDAHRGPQKSLAISLT